MTWRRWRDYGIILLVCSPVTYLGYIFGLWIKQ